jgi:hypothetical protein
MSKINDGGPAFPVPGLMHDETFNGLSMRDYFAAKALQGFCAGAQAGDDIDELPDLVYMLADAMLRRREQT